MLAISPVLTGSPLMMNTTLPAPLRGTCQVTEELSERIALNNERARAPPRGSKLLANGITTPRGEGRPLAPMPGLRSHDGPRVSLPDQRVRYPAVRRLRPRPHGNVRVRSRRLLHRGLFFRPPLGRLFRLSRSRARAAPRVCSQRRFHSPLSRRRQALGAGMRLWFFSHGGRAVFRRGGN